MFSNTQFNRLGVSVLTGLWVAWAVAAMGEFARPAIASCSNYNHACKLNMPVPCSQATCVPTSKASPPPQATCSNNAPSYKPDFYDETITTGSWTICYGAWPWQAGGSCNQALVECSRRTYYVSNCTTLCEPQAVWVMSYCHFWTGAAPAC